MSTETLTELISIVKLMTNETNNTTIQSYLTMAEAIVLKELYPYDDSKTDVPARYNYDMARIAAYLINKAGADGELVHSENGVSRTYEAGDIPPSLLRHITPFTGVIR